MEGTIVGPTTEWLRDRDLRALTEYMTVCAGTEMSADTPGVYTVVSRPGARHIVNVEAGTCDCRDAAYNRPAGGCKHRRRVEFVTGRRPIPGWIDESTLDDQLRHDIEAGRNHSRGSSTNS